MRRVGCKNNDNSGSVQCSLNRKWDENVLDATRRMSTHCSRQAKLDDAKVVARNSLPASFPPVHPFAWDFSFSLRSWSLTIDQGDVGDDVGDLAQ